MPLTTLTFINPINSTIPAYIHKISDIYIYTKNTKKLVITIELLVLGGGLCSLSFFFQLLRKAWLILGIRTLFECFLSIVAVFVEEDSMDDDDDGHGDARSHICLSEFKNCCTSYFLLNTQLNNYLK